MTRVVCFWLLTVGILLTPAPATAQSLDFQFYRTRVEPILLKVRDGNGPGGSCFGCHMHAATRLRLQPVSPSLTWTEEQSRSNFQAVSRLVTPGDPLKSRLLMQALAVEAGGAPIHAGGKQWKSQDDPEWQTLAAWVRTGTAAAPAASTAAPVLSFDVFKARVQPILLNKRQGLARCAVCHSQGTNFPLQPPPAAGATWTDEQSRRNFASVQRLVVPGDPLTSRLLMMPLAEEAGGDPFHPGGKHWSSQSDPEWQILAAWVRGQ